MDRTDSCTEGAVSNPSNEGLFATWQLMPILVQRCECMHNMSNIIFSIQNVPGGFRGSQKSHKLFWSDRLQWKFRMDTDTDKREGAVVSSSCKMQGLPVPQQQEDIETSRLPVIFGIFRALNTNNHHMHTSRQSERSPVTRRELGAGSAGYCEIPPRPMRLKWKREIPYKMP